MSGYSKFARFDRLRYCQLVCWKGQEKAFELVKDDQIARKTIQILGETIPLGEHDIIKLEKLVCKLYNEPM